MKNERKRTFKFGKIAMWPTSRKANAVEVEISVRMLNNGQPEFSAMGAVWNCRHTDWISGGQNLDELRKYIKDPVFEEIYDLWVNFHLNGMYSGTAKQTQALKEESDRRNATHRAKGEKEEEPLNFASRYEDACEYLKSINLYIDSLGEGEVLSCEEGGKVTAKHYPYGCGWVTRILTDETMKRINSLLDEGKVYGEKEVA